MRFIILAFLLIISSPVGAQVFPSPTYNNLTVLNSFSLSGSFSAGTSVAAGTALSAGTSLSVGTTSALNGDTTIGISTAAAIFNLNGPNNTARSFYWQTAGVNRWQWQLTGNETGSNVGSDLRLFAQSDSGAPNAEVVKFTRSNGNVAFNGNNTFSSPTFTFNGQITNNSSFFQQGTRTLVSGTSMGQGPVNPMGQFQNISWAGVLDTGSGVPNFNTWIIADTVNISRALPSTADFSITHNYNSGASGDRENLSIVYNKEAASTDGLSTAPFNILAFMHFDVGECVNPNPACGRASSVNFDTRLGNLAGTSNIAASVLLVQENDLRMTATSTASIKGNTSFHNGIADAGHGTLEDFGIAFSSAGSIAHGTGGNTVLIQLGEVFQDWPIDTTLTNSAIMQVKAVQGGGVTHAWQAVSGYGIDLFGINLVNNAWRSTGWTVDGQGQQTIGPVSLSYISGGAHLSVPGFTEVSAAVASAGTGYLVGDVVWDTFGGLWTVATVSGTTIATVTPISGHTGFPTSANPLGNAVNGGTGTGATLNITTASTGLLQIGDAGQNVNVGSGSALSTSATAGFLQLPTMAGAPTGNCGGATGKACFVVDTTNKKLCYNISGTTWECTAALTP